MNKIFLPYLLLVSLGLMSSACRETPPPALPAVLKICTWEDSFPEDLLAEFDREFGIEVELDYYEDEEYLLSILQSTSSRYDLILVGDGLIRGMIQQRLLAPVDTDRLENFSQVPREFRDLPFDPELSFSIPIIWGTTGIAVNRGVVEAETISWNLLWDERYAGRIAMLNNMESVIGGALKALGHPYFSNDESHLREAERKLLDQAPLIRGYLSRMEIAEKLETGGLVLAQIYSDDGYLINNPEVRYYVPREGGELWVDCLAVPRDAFNKNSALLFIDFILRPETGAELAEHLMLGVANIGSNKILQDRVSLTVEALDWNQTRKVSEMSRDRGEMKNRLNRIWARIKQADKNR